MRPRKKVLLLCAGVRGETLELLLSVRGRYTVHVAKDADDALWLMRHGTYDALLAEVLPQSEEANDLARQANLLRKDISTVLFSASISDYQRGSHADYFIPELLCNSEVILNRVGLATVRKRGPKKAVAA